MSKKLNPFAKKDKKEEVVNPQPVEEITTGTLDDDGKAETGVYPGEDKHAKEEETLEVKVPKKKKGLELAEVKVIHAVVFNGHQTHLKSWPTKCRFTIYLIDDYVEVATDHENSNSKYTTIRIPLTNVANYILQEDYIPKRN